MKDLGAIMRQAQEMQTKLQEAQEKIATTEVSGEAGAGLVSVILNGQGHLVGLRINPSLLNPSEAEVLEDLLKAAHADAKAKVDAMVARMTEDAMGGLGGMLPGFKMPF